MFFCCFGCFFCGVIVFGFVVGIIFKKLVILLFGVLIVNIIVVGCMCYFICEFVLVNDVVGCFLFVIY